MEHIQETISIPSQDYVASFWQFAYLRFVFILLAGLALANIGLMILAQSITPTLAPANPFLDYANLFPGRPISALEGKGFSCWNSHTKDGSFAPACSVTPPSGAFSAINLFISNGVIRQISFILRDDTLRAGDLILLFNKPNFRVYPHNVFFFWNNLFVHVSTTDRGNPAPMRPVWSVTFAST